MAVCLGGNLEVDTKSYKQARAKINEAIENNAKTTTLFIQERKIRPKKGSKFAVEILKATLVRPDQATTLDQYKPAQPVLRGGVPYVDIDDGEVYAVKIYNENDFEIAAD